MFNSINKLLRSKCFNCHKLKIKDKLIIYYYLKLLLIKLGYLGDAKYLDNLIYSPICPNNNILGIFFFNLDIFTDFFKKKDININMEEMTVSTEEANTIDIDNTNEDEHNVIKQEDSEETNNEKGKKRKKKNKNNTENDDVAFLVKPLTATKIKNITRILEKLNKKVVNFEADLNVKILQR